MPRISADIHIDAAPQEVWDVATDLKGMDRWVSIHQSFPGTLPEKLKEGDRFRQSVKVAGVPFHVEWTATGVDSPAKLVWDGTGPAGTTAHTSYTLEAEGGGTRFTFENEFALPAGRIGKAAGRVVAGQAKKELNRSLETLKKLLES